MERIAVVGVSWRRAEAQVLQRFTVAEELQPELLPRLAGALRARELLYLATCNRVEVAFVAARPTTLALERRAVYEVLSGSAPAPGEAEHLFRAWAGEGAAEHLFLLATGLDSAQVGETEIAGQLRRSYDRSRALDLVGPRLDLVTREALKLAKRIRLETAIGAGHTSLAEIALGLVRERLAETPGAVALVGVSPMTERCAQELEGERVPFFVVNRTESRARALCERLGGGAAAARGLADFRERPERVEAVLSATGSPEPVFDRAALERLAARSPSGRPPLIVDLAIPPDVDSEDARAARLPRVDMQTITAEAQKNRELKVRKAAGARLLVDEALEKLRRRIGERALAPLVAALHRRYKRTAIEGVERLFRKELGGLGEVERDAVRRWAETLAGRFAHIPSTGLRNIAVEYSPLALQAFFADADAGLLEELGTIAKEGDLFSGFTPSPDPGQEEPA